MMKQILTTLLAALTLFTGIETSKAQDADGPIVVELFTSQGCSSCPPADQIMNQLATKANIIPISYHVTYWDYIGWKDPLGRIVSDQRQRRYGEYKRSRRIYTPQMIINGKKEFVGSRKHEAQRNLQDAKPLKTITLAGMTPENIQANLPQAPIGKYAIWIAGVQKEQTQKIGRGENANRQVTYTNSVLSLTQAPKKWDGTAKTLTLDLPKSENIDHYVVFAQLQAFGPIVAAGKIRL